jgi:phage terminase large subunit GpA-like protein
MKGAQIGATTGVLENTIAYYIGECPSDILFVSATQDNLKKWVIKKLEPLLDSCELRDLISHQTDNKKSRQTGDLAFMKEFLGGSLVMASAQSPAALRQDSIRILLRDEIDGSPTLLTTGEGNWLDVSSARTIAFGNRGKIADVSTPTEYDISNIRQMYERGDQRKYLIPCPFCGEYQELQWGNEDTKYGIKVDMQAGEIIRVYYSCQKCGEAISNSHKTYMLSKGRWEPTVKSSSKFRRSYHISALYSPIGMFSWESAYLKFLEAQEDSVNGMRSFVNLIQGLPYKETVTRPRISNISKGTYKRGTVPDDVLFLTIGVDVQGGSAKDKKRPPRLELEICGHGSRFRTWSIDYKIIKGKITDPFEGAWQEFREMITSGKMTFRRADGLEFTPVLGLIDMGHEGDTVFKFCQTGATKLFAARGFRYLVQRKKELKGEGVLDEMTPDGVKGWRWTKRGESGYYQFSGAFYKRIFYSNLIIPRRDRPPQRAGFCEFPDGYPNKYYGQLTAEEMRADGITFVLPTGRTNEALDCRVLNLVAQHIYLEGQVKLQREFGAQQGFTDAQLKSIDVGMVLNKLQVALDLKIKEIRKKLNS